MSLISVIVPIYKVEPYLRKCVDSIINQSYRNLEIILVDDGSPDNCGAICDEYAAKDSRIKVIHKPNGGLSDARNAGMDIMSGDYVAFVDSDDWIEPNMYERLLQLITEYQADIAVGGVTDDFEYNNQITSTKVSDYGSVPFAESNTNAMRRYFHTSCAAWDKLYKADLFDGIRYPVGEINEDEAIVLHILARCSKVCYTSEIFYHYMHRNSGATITSSPFSIKKLAWQRHCISNLEFIRTHYPDLEQDAAKRCRDSLMWSLTEIALAEESFDSAKKDMLRVLKENRALFRKCEFSFPQDRIRLFLLTYAPSVYEFAIRLKRGLRK